MEDSEIPRIPPLGSLQRSKQIQEAFQQGDDFSDVSTPRAYLWQPRGGLSEEMLSRLNSEDSSAARGKAFQAEGTAPAKALRQETAQLCGSSSTLRGMKCNARSGQRQDGRIRYVKVKGVPNATSTGLD